VKQSQRGHNNRPGKGVNKKSVQCALFYELAESQKMKWFMLALALGAAAIFYQGLRDAGRGSADDQFNSAFCMLVGAVLLLLDAAIFIATVADAVL
jgi:hypothetical protein